MKLTAVLFVVAFVFSAVCAEPEDTSTNVLHDVSSTALPDKTTPTSAPTKPEPTTPTTPPPSSSSSAAPTKPTPPTSTTSPIPSTSTPSPTSPAPHPTPKPAPKEYYWKVTDDKGAICILAKADITLKLTYMNATKEETKEIKISPNATSSGFCNETSQVLKLVENDTSIDFIFSQNGTENYHLSQIKSDIALNNSAINQSVISLASDELKVFKTKLNTSYECRWSEPAVLKEVDQYFNVTKATLRVNMDNIRIEAFRDMAGDNFAKAYTCEMDNTDLVPIMVGIALGILVAVVLIAYLVGRRNTQAQGYLSM